MDSKDIERFGNVLSDIEKALHNLSALACFQVSLSLMASKAPIVDIEVMIKSLQAIANKIGEAK